MKSIKLLALGLCSVFCLNATGNRPVSNAALADASTHSFWGNEAPAEKQSRKIKVALLLDTSNSMDGLIEQAKSQLWSIVNELARAQADNLSPDLQIAIYHYGNTGLASEKGYIQQVTPFTSDLDLVSEKLFSLRTNGGSEFCGQAIYTSLKDLEWGDEKVDYKTIFIAGNEPFDQGSVQPGVALNLARQKDVFVNSIYCGGYQSGISEGWNATLTAAIGGFMNIDSDQKTAYISTPYDQKIDALNASLNTTYLWYGAEGQKAYENMNVQDLNAAHYGLSNSVDRTMMKSSRLYNNRNDGWDLVDKVTTDPGFSVSTVSATNLPEEMRKMTLEEKQRYILQKKNQRGAITHQIAQLGESRAQYIAAEKSKSGDQGSLQSAILTTIQDQARTKGFSFAKTNTISINDLISKAEAEPEFVPANVDFDYFMELAAEVKEYRKDRLVDFTTFLGMAKEPRTVILDARSTEHFDAMHIKGAIHLDYSMFNLYDLARLIPDKNTRILIYCNNNFDTQSEAAFENIAKPEVRMEIERNLVSKAGPIRFSANEEVLKLKPNTYAGIEMDPKKTLALNIHTFINLYGYGYQNVYELSQLVRPNDPRLELEGNAIPADWRVRP